jgi:hypothetical protein
MGVQDKKASGWNCKVERYKYNIITITVVSLKILQRIIQHLSTLPTEVET